MSYQAIFKRYELKYLLTQQQKETVLRGMEPYMLLDRYGRTTIRNIYFDTDNYRLIRNSIEKPVYKEKLRLRSYRRATPDSPVFVELKKKYNGVVYKRRVELPEQQAVDWISGKIPGPDSQIGREIEYFRRFYSGLHPTAFLSYEREAYYCRSGGDFRVTFDENILCRREEMSLERGVWGTPLLEEGKVLMEIKTAGGMPLWMADLLSRERIFKTSYSKYGTAYRQMIYKGDRMYA